MALSSKHRQSVDSNAKLQSGLKCCMTSLRHVPPCVLINSYQKEISEIRKLIQLTVPTAVYNKLFHNSTCARSHIRAFATWIHR